MQPVVAVLGFELGRVVGVAHKGVEINDAVALLAVANPIVNVLTRSLVEDGVIAVALERSNRGEIYLDALVVDFCHHSAVSLDELGGAFLRIACAADVIDAFKNDERGDALLSKDVAVKTFQCGFAQSTLDDAVAADAEVEDAHLAAETFGEEVGPTVLHIGGRAASICDAVAEAGDYGSFCIGFHLDGGDVVPVVNLLLRVKIALGLALAVDDVRRGARATVRSGVFRSAVAVIDGDAQALERFEVLGNFV